MFAKGWLGISFFVLVALSNPASAANDPTIDQVYQATQAGRLDEAQGMMSIVLQDHPDSAKAHFVEAEISAKQGQLERAKAELNKAESLKPGLPFAKPESVQQLRARIASGNPVNAQTSGSFQSTLHKNTPWGLIFLGIGSIAVIFLIVRAMNARNPSTFPANPQAGIQNPNVYPAQPYSPAGAAMPVAGGGMASGIVGGLATGAALGVGMVAGEELAHHFLDGNNASSSTAAATDTWNTASNDFGGADFGISGDASSWDDNSVVADSGDMGDDWS